VLDASSSASSTDVYGCNSAWVPKQTLGSSVVFVGGKATLAATLLDAGLREARIRVTDNATSAQGCSLDNFAIRPASLEVVASHATESTPGTATLLDNTTTAGTVIHRAWREFSVTVTGKTALGATVTNYDGTPDLTATHLSPAAFTGTIEAGSWQPASGGSRRTDQAKYGEAGAVTIKAEDTSWANVDAVDTDIADRKFSGTVAAGRFVPDHFSVVRGALSPSCTNGSTGFSYLGSTLAWASPAVTLTAENALNVPTKNYTAHADLMKLSATEIGTPAYTVAAGTLGTVGSLGVLNLGEGQVAVQLPSLTFARTLTAAFDANIRVDFPDFDGDADGIQPTDYPLVLGASGGVAFSPDFRSQRFGRLYFGPKYGSELLEMDVPLRAEYFDGAAWVQNAADTCTSMTQAYVAFAGLPGQTHAVQPTGVSNGLWNVKIQPPNPRAQGSATLTLDVAGASPSVPYPLLADDSNADGSYAEDPTRTVYFGLHAQDERWIYQRDVTGD
jgi:MSHA biogenesis protein MshQ